MALKHVKKVTRTHKYFTVYVDSLSAVQAIQNKNFKNKNVRRVYNALRGLPTRVHITFIWTPAHVGVKGNEKADTLAKAETPILWS